LLPSQAAQPRALLIFQARLAGAFACRQVGVCHHYASSSLPPAGGHLLIDADAGRPLGAGTGADPLAIPRGCRHRIIRLDCGQVTHFSADVLELLLTFGASLPAIGCQLYAAACAAAPASNC